jgi:hypothetical protein
MNWGALALGGTVAAIVLVAAFYVAAPMKRQKPTDLAREILATDSTSVAMTLVVGLAVLLGFLISWLYAAIRPRFGPGAATAVRVGLFVWLAHQGIFLARIAGSAGAPETGDRLTLAVVLLVADLAAALAAGAIYWETPETRHRRESGRWPTST